MKFKSMQAVISSVAVSCMFFCINLPACASWSVTSNVTYTAPGSFYLTPEEAHMEATGTATHRSFHSATIEGLAVIDYGKEIECHYVFSHRDGVFKVDEYETATMGITARHIVTNGYGQNLESNQTYTEGMDFIEIELPQSPKAVTDVILIRADNTGLGIRHAVTATNNFSVFVPAADFF